MSESQDEIAVSLKELQQVCDAINGGADYFESQLVSSSQLAESVTCVEAEAVACIPALRSFCAFSVTESVKGYAAEVLQTATQHLVNMAELTEEMMLQQSATIGQLNTQCSSILQVCLLHQTPYLHCIWLHSCRIWQPCRTSQLSMPLSLPPPSPTLV